jgi:hypothetical protein
VISPSEQRIIHIELTNACDYRCSNCTRFTGHIAKPFFMDFATLRRAVLSMKGYRGMVGIMGGEPTLHPDFRRLVEYYADHVGGTTRSRAGREAMDDFAVYRERHLSSLDAKRGLWTSLGGGYYEHFELIQEVFDYQCINDHANPGLHQALLISRRSLGISDHDWIGLRDSCWLQGMWSASITPKGAFFCEVAAALDMLFEGPGGWPIEPGWWSRRPADFGDQLRWCEMCSAALQVPRRRASEGIDDVSPDNLDRLAEAGSPKVKMGKVRVFDCARYDPARYAYTPDSDCYMPAAWKGKRVSRGNRSIRMRRLEGLLVCVDYADFLECTLPGNSGHFDRLVVVTAPHDVRTQTIARKHGAELVVSDSCYANGDAFNKARMLNEGVRALEFSDWVLLTDADIFLPAQLRPTLDDLVLNPGCLYYTRRYHLPEYDLNRHLEAFLTDRSLIHSYSLDDPSTNQMPWGYFQLFNVRARALEGRGRDLFPEVFTSAGNIDTYFQRLWPADKKVQLPVRERLLDVVHIPHGPLGINWNGRVTGAAGNRCGHDSRGAPAGWFFAGQTNIRTRMPNPASWPAGCYVKMVRIDTAEQVIMRNGEGVAHGGFHHGGAHLGFFSRGHEVDVDRKNAGAVIVEMKNGREFTGWGLGHVMWEDDRQGYVWDGIPINPTDFEFSCRWNLADCDRPYYRNF